MSAEREAATELPQYPWPRETMTVAEVAATVRYTSKTVRQHHRCVGRISRPAARRPTGGRALDVHAHQDARDQEAADPCPEARQGAEGVQEAQSDFACCAPARPHDRYSLPAM
jgi:hypothetical protein